MRTPMGRQEFWRKGVIKGGAGEEAVTTEGYWVIFLVVPAWITSSTDLVKNMNTCWHLYTEMIFEC